jgi:hypothetical protein
MRAARRDLDEQSAERMRSATRQPAVSARARATSAPPARPTSGMAPSMVEGGASLADDVRMRADKAAEQRAAENAAKRLRKDEAFVRRQEAVANERAVKRLYAEQVRVGGGSARADADLPFPHQPGSVTLVRYHCP